MWFRSLVFFAFAWFIGMLMRRLVSQAPVAGSRATSPPRGSVPDRVDDVMVRDRICNTFLPKSRALVERRDGVSHYFCSERCRSSFRTAPAPAEAAATPR